MANDSLARGAKSHTFPSNSHISDARWAAAFGTPEPELKKPAKKTKRVPKVAK